MGCPAPSSPRTCEPHTALCATSTPAWSISTPVPLGPNLTFPLGARNRAETATASWGTKPSRNLAKSRPSSYRSPRSSSHFPGAASSHRDAVTGLLGLKDIGHAVLDVASGKSLFGQQHWGIQ